MSSSSNTLPFYHPKYRADIDGLRAIAILSVVAFHAFPTWLTGGFIGVDVFFVISGYLISVIIFKNLDAGTFSFNAFYMRRVKRIFPALLLVLVACYVYGWFTLFADEYKQVGKHVSAGAFFVSNIALYLESGYFDTVAETKPLLHLWSLGVEEQYYIFWPVIAYWLWKLKTALPWVIGAILLGSFTLNILFVEVNSSAVFYLPITRAWELLGGTMLAYMVTHTSRPRTVESNAVIGNLLSLSGLALLGIAVVTIDRQKDFPGWWAVLPVMGAVLLILAGEKSWVNRFVLSRPLLVWFGLISYPLYLWHWPVLAYYRMVAPEVPSAGIRFALVLLSIGLAWMTFRYIEQPVRFGQKRIVSNKALIIAMFVVGAVGQTTYDNNGFEEREANDFKLEASYDWTSWYRHKSCFIDTKNGVGAFASLCDGESADMPPRPLVLLWGDSHAASLYPGLKKQADLLGFRLAQYNANGCPPVLGFVAKSTEPQCREINDFVLGKIHALKPDLVVMAGFWNNYNGQDKWSHLESDTLQASFERLAEVVDKLVVVGQLPVMDIAQPHVAARVFKAAKNNRTFSHFKDASITRNSQLAAMLAPLGIGFVSPTDLLCDGRGCLISTTLDALKPVAWDYGHLTRDGSELLITMAVEKGLLKLPR